jgi:hypothetical protein
MFFQVGKSIQKMRNSGKNWDPNPNKAEIIISPTPKCDVDLINDLIHFWSFQFDYFHHHAILISIIDCLNDVAIPHPSIMETNIHKKLLSVLLIGFYVFPKGFG